MRATDATDHCTHMLRAEAIGLLAVAVVAPVFSPAGAAQPDSERGQAIAREMQQRDHGSGDSTGTMRMTLVDASGGEKQRVAIARALINQPPLILADEPTGNLDSQSGQEVAMILHDVARDSGCAVIVVTHDPRVEEIADRILWLEDGALRDRRAERHSWVRCPVCGMRVDEWNARHSAEHEGQRVVFCSQRCQERYFEKPAAYAA